jgi:hypothetical protein
VWRYCIRPLLPCFCWLSIPSVINGISLVALTLHKDHMELSLPSSETDPFRCGILLTMAAADDDIYLVRSLRHLLTRYPTDSLSVPLFFTSSTQYFIRQFVIDTLRTQLRKLGHPAYIIAVSRRHQRCPGEAVARGPFGAFGS